MSGPQSHSGLFGEAKILFPLLGIEPQFLGCPCRGLVAILPTLSWLHIQGTGVILQLWNHCIYLVFMFLLLVPFFPCLWHTTLILHEFEGEKVRIFEKHLSGLFKNPAWSVIFCHSSLYRLSSGKYHAQGCTNPGQLNFVWWHQIFMGPWYENYFLASFRRLEIWGGFYVFGKFVHLYLMPKWFLLIVAFQSPATCFLSLTSQKWNFFLCCLIWDQILIIESFEISCTVVFGLWNRHVQDSIP